MTSEKHLFAAYTDEVLAFAWQDAPRTETPPTPSVPEELEQAAERFLRLLEKSRKTHLVLLGLGSGRLAGLLAASLPPATALTVCELAPERARGVLEAGNAAWRTPGGPAQLLVDSSPWAVAYLLAQGGGLPAEALVQLNPELRPDEREKYQSLQRTLTLARSRAAINGTPFGHFAVQAPSLSTACILHPDEPHLDQFFGQFPDWVEELVVIWDAKEIPEREITAACPLRQFAHPLENDFAAQRNRMLAECKAEWVLFLDGDERFSEDHWTLLPGLFPVRGTQAYFFPRLTFHPDAEHCRMGYGLWPDLQLRLFRNLPDLRFENAVHERLTGLSGRTGLVLDAPILHTSHLHKKPEALRKKLALFDKASGGTVRHRLNQEYPHLPLSRFRRANLLCNELQVLLLPQIPA
ncbi:MAG: glycosyl transferase family 2 [Desulfovibrio sp.]